MNNQKGSLTVAMTFIIPLILIIVASVAWVFHLLSTKEKLEHACRQNVLKSQEVLISYGETIRSLNPVSIGLELKRKLALAMMVIPHTAAAGHILYRSARTLQRALKLTQRTLFTLGEAQARFYLHKQKFTLVQLYNKKGGSFFWNILWAESRTSRTRLRLVKTSHATAPTYGWAENLERKQETNIRWKLIFKKSGFFQKWLNQGKPLQWKGRCYARPEKRNGKWIPILGRAKSL